MGVVADSWTDLGIWFWLNVLTLSRGNLGLRGSRQGGTERPKPVESFT